MHKPFMGVNQPEDGPIFVQTMNQGDQGKVVSGLGNSDMKSFKTNESAMNIVNSDSVKSEFGLGSVPSVSTAPVCHLQQHALHLSNPEEWVSST